MSPKVREIIERTRAEVVAVMADEIEVGNIGVLSKIDELILIDAAQNRHIAPAQMLIKLNGDDDQPEDRSEADSAIIKGLQNKLEDLKRENRELRTRLPQNPKPRTQNP